MDDTLEHSFYSGLKVIEDDCEAIIYHYGGQAIFHKDQDYRSFNELMKEAKERSSVKIFAYCLMPNHFHLVLQPDRAYKLSKWMQWLMTSHVRRYHRHYQTSGHVWQGRFKSFIVKEDDYLLTLLRYVEGNPVRAGMMDRQSTGRGHHAGRELAGITAW